MKINKIFQLIFESNLNIKKAAEIGVYSFASSSIKPLIERGITCDLFEAIPDYSKKIAADIANFPNAEVHNLAVSNYSGDITFFLAGPSTFDSSQMESPAINHDNFDKNIAEKVTVQCVDFSQIDTGDYDFISIDVEGGEYRILERMKSRPKLINLETQSRDYINPKLGSITDWMIENNYTIWFRNNTDTIFIKKPRVSIGIQLNLNAWWHNKKFFGGRL